MESKVMIDAQHGLARSLVGGTLDLICPQMELLVCPDYFDVALAGSGVIRSDDRGQLYFKMTAPFKGRPHRALRNTRPQGEAHDEHDHVMLRAVDHNGREWRSNWLLMDLRFPTLQPSWLVRHNIKELISFNNVVPFGKTSFVELYIPNQRRLMFDQKTTKKLSAGGTEVESGWSIDHHKGALDDAEVIFRKEDGDWLTVNVTRDSPIKPDWPGLVCQALEFACARCVRPAVVVRQFNDRRHTGLFSGPFWQFRSQLPPPLHPKEPGDAASFWMLIERFFSFMSKGNVDTERLLDELEGIRNGATGSVQTACLTLAVGIESICNILLPDVSSSISKDDMKSLLDHIGNWSGDGGIQSRAKDVVGNMRGVRAADKLYAWATSQGVDHVLVDRWKAIRNPRAHGAELSEDQTLFDRYYSAVELLYRIIAWSIGFDEPILRTSVRGWGQEDDVGPESK